MDHRYAYSSGQKENYQSIMMPEYEIYRILRKCSDGDKISQLADPNVCKRIIDIKYNIILCSCTKGLCNQSKKLVFDNKLIALLSFYIFLNT